MTYDFGIIAKLLYERNARQDLFAEAIGVRPQTITDWKSGRSKTWTMKLPQIAQYFNVTTDQLLGKENENAEAALNSTEKKLILIARKVQDIPREERDKLIEHFEASIDMYLNIIRQKENKSDT